MEVDEVLSGLTDAQRRAVTHPAGPLAIQAGAGSGKTRVLTRRIAYRAAVDDLDPRAVVALTFTRKAAGELATRLRRLGLRDTVTVGTFHAVAYRQLRARWADQGLNEPTLLRSKTRLVASLLPPSSTVSPAEVAGEIEWAKARMVSPRQYLAAANAEGRRTRTPAGQVGELFAAYEAEKRRRRTVDFDDLLRLARFDLGDDRAYAAAIGWRHRHFFVDEFQDVNPLQFALLQAWLGGRDDVCVVGDPRQSIYGWNGADAHHLIDFGDHYPGAPTIVLDENHRSTPQVLAVAGAALAAGDRHEVPPTGPTVEADGPIPVVTAYPDEAAEAAGIARAARDAHLPGTSWSRQAVLVRTKAQLPVLERAFAAAGIPTRVRGRADLSDDPTTRTLIERLERASGTFARRLDELRSEVVESAGAAGAPGAAPPLDPVVARAVVAAAEEYRLTDPDASVAAFDAWLRDRGGDDRLGGDAVELCTFHAAKGLEWPVVHLAGLEAGFVPIAHARTPEARAEEQRLLYVAVTRAEHTLRCTWARSRTFGERTVAREPSPLLAPVEAAIERLRAADRPVQGPGVATFFADQRHLLDGVPPGPSPTDDTGRPRLRALAGTKGQPFRDAPRPGEAAAADHDAHAALVAWRASMARAADVVPSVIFPDRTLAEVAERRPTTLDELAGIDGVGPVKVHRYGDALLRILQAHRAG